MRFDLPTPDGDSQVFWEAAREGRLLIKRCRACGRPHYYPRPFCPHCWSEEVKWEQASGRATLYTYSVVYENDLPPFSGRVPYVAAIVDLEEGPRAMTNVVGCPPEDVRIGMAVRVRFEPVSDEAALPLFEPAF